MTRVPNTNYQAAAGTQFIIATDDADAFDREDISKLATGVDLHDHDVGRGLPVKRVAAGAVGTAGLADGAATTVKMGASSVTGTILAADSVDASHIQAGAVGASEIVDGGVGTAELANSAVTLGKMASGTANRLFATNGSGVPSLLQLAALMVPNGILTEAMMVPSTITGNSGSSAIGAGVLHANRMVASSFDATQVNAAFAAGAIGGSKLTDNTVDEPKINAATIPNNEESLGWNGTQWYWRKIDYPQLRTSNTPSDAQVLTWNNSGLTMYWATPTSGAVLTAIVAAVPTAAQIPSGWSRETGLDGRVMVFDGTVFSNTFVENNSYGISWGHLHGHATTHSHPMAAAGVSGNTGGPSGTNTTGSTGNTSADGSHTHNQGSLDITGSSDAVGPGSTDATSWQFPARAYVPVKHV